MKREKIETFQERQIITYMIVSTEYLREIISIIQARYFETSFCKIVCEWILEYWNEYKQAPGKQIQDIYNRKSLLLKNEDELDLLSSFLNKLSCDWEKIKIISNIKFATKEALLYIKKRSLILLKEQLEFCLDKNDILKAEQSLSVYNRIELPTSDYIDILNNPQVISDAFEVVDEILIVFPGILGEVVGGMNRGDLCSFLGAAKKGKTWWLLYTALTGVTLGKSVFFLNFEMIQSTMIRRAWMGLSAEPRYSGKIKIPSFESVGDKENIKYRIIIKEVYKDDIKVEDISKKQKKLKKLFRMGQIRMKDTPSYSWSISDIESYLDVLYFYENYIPDILIIDYADLIKPNKINGEYRHQLDGIWKDLRRIAMERNILIVTASQAGRNAFSNDATEEHISEDIRKLAHVSKMIAINQSKQDYKANCVRIEKLVDRDGEKGWRQALVLQCLQIGKVYIDSRYSADVLFK